MKTITVGLISPGSTAALRSAVVKAEAVKVAAEVTEYCLERHDAATERIVAARPEVVIIDMVSRDETLQCLRILRTALPDGHLIVAAANDPQMIVEAMRAGAREFLESPVSEAAVTAALDRFRKEHVQTTTSKEPAGRLYSIIAGKLSSGATTVAINAANAIAGASDGSALLIDMDIPLGDAAAYLNLRPQYTVKDALGSADRLDGTLLENFTVKVKNTTLNLLGGFRDYTSRSSVAPEALERLMQVSRHAYRHTIVDLSGSFDSEQAVVVAKQSHLVLVVLTPDLPAIWRTEKLLTFLGLHGAGDTTRLILNRTSRKDDIGGRDIERLLSQPVYCTLPNDYAGCLRAINAGRPLQPEDSKTLHQAVQKLASLMTGAETVKDSKGLLSLFLRPSTIGGQ